MDIPLAPPPGAAAGTVAVFGAGSIGAYLGGALLGAGTDVTLLGRTRMRRRIAEHGLHLTDLHGRALRLDGARVPYAEDAAVLAEAALILVTVKSADTAAAAEAIRMHARPDALVLSLQNGVGNADTLRRILPGRAVLAGMVPFNVVQMPDGRLHRGTAGELMAEASPALRPWLAAFAAAHLPITECTDFASIQWGKLLINLNNSVNALSGVPLVQQLRQRGYRRALALMVDEGRAVLARAGIRPAKVVSVGPAAFSLILRLPDALFTRVAASMLKIDPEARSSMWEDLQAGRKTEVHYLNGAITALAASLGMDAPVNRRMTELVTAAEESKQGVLGADEMFRILSSALCSK
ncbi:2-dehydropantoate 2-reductase [Massilia sp. Root418]|jgi:2-dehydropantoate 2-reductase|uniref:2-dehydropantoate 2-reductase n=1 Tax=Massilia sp. Root418 TaxID=1736532 RepID=UPI00070043C2|nr:2-dehydropantoate 2-reductase [Massilia sp. Root418]KQW89921.1 2-dehydropantoate 2-reductase [Massilia sp. Root418]